MTCVNCGRGFHKECVRKKGCSKCHPEPDAVESASVVIEAQSLQEKLEETVELPQLQPPPEPKKNKVGGTYADLKDPQSTGRKRAAKLYPLDSEEPCEWQGKKNCGGGRVPIVGCLDGLQVARHHGPVKNTTRNHLGNVHRICTACHNHWHELNDLVYDEREYGMLPHDPEEATREEIIMNQVEWVTGEMAKKHTLASSVNKGVKFHD